MNFDSTQKELLNYVSSNPIWRIFLPICEVLLIGGQIILIVINFGLHLGVIKTIIGILVLVAIVITLAKGNYKALAYGLGLRALMYLIFVIQSVVGKYGGFDLGSVIYMLIWAYFAFIAYKKVQKI